MAISAPPGILIAKITGGSISWPRNASLDTLDTMDGRNYPNCFTVEIAKTAERVTGLELRGMSGSSACSARSAVNCNVWDYSDCDMAARRAKR